MTVQTMTEVVAVYGQCVVHNTQTLTGQSGKDLAFFLNQGLSGGKVLNVSVLHVEQYR